MKSKILVSACLMGFQVRYNGSEKAQLAGMLARWQRDNRLVIHCPELAAWLALRAALESGCDAALLTDGSPTCGSQFIYDGTFSGQRKPGSGVAAALLREWGITVFSDGQVPQLLAWMAARESSDDLL